MSIKKSIIIAAMAVSFIFAGFSAYQKFIDETDSYESNLPVENLTVEMQSGGSHDFKVEIAEKSMDIRVGLMYRKSMPKNHGMLFKMGKNPRPTGFWMKNTLIPLDMLFVAQDGKIINIHHNAQPLSLGSIKSGGPVTAVIELNGGRADEIGIKIGDKVRHPYFQDE